MSYTREAEISWFRRSGRNSGDLSWQAADVGPVLQITESFGWDRPAQSESSVVGAAVVIIRLWLAIGMLAIVKRIWDGWGATSSTPSPPQ